MVKNEIEVVTDNHALNNEEQEIKSITKDLGKLVGKRRLIIIGSILLGGAISVIVPSVVPGMLGIAEVTPEILHGLLVGGIGAGLAGAAGFSLVGMVAYNKPIRNLKRKLNKLDPERKKRYEDLANERSRNNPENKMQEAENNEFMYVTNLQSRKEKLQRDIDIELNAPKKEFNPKEEGYNPKKSEKEFIDKEIERKKELAQLKIKKAQAMVEKLNKNEEQELENASKTR